MKKRIFIGSFIDFKGLKKRYDKIKTKFRGIVYGKWTDIQNLHLTYKFIGNVNEQELKDIFHQLKTEINFEREVKLEFNGLGAFPNIYNPRILFMKVKDKNGCLTEFHNTIEEKLSSIGIKKEDREFIPHITLIRIKNVKIDRFIKVINEFKETKFGIQEGLEINVIESVLSSKGAKYIKLQPEKV